MKNQSLVEAISSLQSKNITSSKLIKCLKKIIKGLHQYSSNSETLPPQTLIPCCLFTLPEKLSQNLLGLSSEEILSEPPQKLSTDLMVQLYLKSLLKLLEESSGEISHVIVEGMSRNTSLLHAYPIIAKKWFKQIVKLWGEEQQNLNLSLRCHLLISRFIGNCSVEMYSWILRRMYVGYFDNAKQVSWRNFEHINFMTNSYCQILKINQSRAYYVLFGYLRSITLQLDKYNKCKHKEKIALLGKLFSNQILNCFKLFAAVVCRNLSEQFSALAYPLVQIIGSYAKLTQSNEYLPLKLRLVDFQLQMMESLRIYIPGVYQLLERVLGSKVFTQKLSKKGQKIAEDVQIMYKLSTTQLKNTHITNYLFKSAITKAYWFASLAAQSVYGIQVIRKFAKTLKKLKTQYVFTGYKLDVSKAVKILEECAIKMYDLRMKSVMNIQDDKPISTYEAKRIKNNYKLSLQKQFELLKDQQDNIIKNKLLAQRQPRDDQKQQESQGEIENNDEVDSGWQEASSGASQFNQAALDQPQREEQSAQNISYEGDPQDGDQAAMQWSEHSWSSQQDLPSN